MSTFLFVLAAVSLLAQPTYAIVKKLMVVSPKVDKYITTAIKIIDKVSTVCSLAELLH